jgi:hypothetical protein
MRVMTSRAIAVAAAAAIALTAATLPASAGGGYYYHRNNDAAAAAAVVGIFGTMAAIIAANQNRRVYNYYQPGVGHRGHWHGYHHHHR